MFTYTIELIAKELQTAFEALDRHEHELAKLKLLHAKEALDAVSQRLSEHVETVEAMAAKAAALKREAALSAGFIERATLMVDRAERLVPPQLQSRRSH